LGLLALGCGPQPVLTETVGAADRAGDPCAEARDRTVREGASVSASLDAGPVKWGSGSVAAARLVEVKLGFDALQKDFGQMAERLCRDRPHVSQAYYERRRECLDRSQVALRGVTTLAGGGADPDPKSVAMALESKLAFLRDALTCGGASPAGESVATHAAAAAAEPVGITAWLTCEQRGANGAYTPVADCGRTPLTAGDRVRLTYRTEAAAHVYLTSRNDHGQFQMIFPAPGEDARVAPGAEVQFPPGGAWMELDEVAGVTELLQVAAFAIPMPALEAQRGRDVPAGGTDPGVLAATVAVEPVLTRGWRLPGGDAKAKNTARGAIELRVIHR
jgi:hypothetical protein